MKRFFNWLKRVFFPPPGARTFRRVLPFLIVVVLMLCGFLAGALAWETSNSTVFCGTTCHTMPPQYVTHQNSYHARLTCEDCHLGRTNLGESIIRKAKYSWQTGSAMIANTYEYPIRAKNMRPARDVCETCHLPETFSDDKVVALKNFAEDEANSATTTYLILKTGGGSKRAGLGFGIHWHVENPVYFYASDTDRQTIPYVRVTGADGQAVEYVDIESGFDPKSVDQSKLLVMDCITCHNRTAHNIVKPADAVDSLMSRGLISADIPDIRKKAVELLNAQYASDTEALAAIDGLNDFYKQNYADFAAKEPQKVTDAVAQLKTYTTSSFFPDQKMNWETHPNNIGHKDFPGCFRCHDGKHVNAAGEVIRLECNLCHSVPVVSQASQLVANIPVNKGIEPPSHKDSKWIAMHRESMDDTCATCHDVTDPGGTSNQSFCSNSACHGSKWKFAGFDAPALRTLLHPGVTPTAPATAGGPATYETVAAIFAGKCTACHGESGPKGVSLISYAAIMGNPGLIKPGDSAGSLLIQVQSGSEPHFGQLSADELALVAKWIDAGAPEK